MGGSFERCEKTARFSEAVLGIASRDSRESPASHRYSFVIDWSVFTKSGSEIVKDKLQTHFDFVESPAYTSFLDLVKPLTTTPLTVRHAQIREFSPPCASLGKGSPVTGTAIYRATTDKWDAAWDLWSTIVPHVPGFMGIAGGHIIEEVDGYKNCFIALVGWENVEVHDHYHHTDHFRERRRILLDPAEGKYNYYGHLAFESTGLVTNEGKAKL